MLRRLIHISNLQGLRGDAQQFVLFSNQSDTNTLSSKTRSLLSDRIAFRKKLIESSPFLLTRPSMWNTKNPPAGVKVLREDSSGRVLLALVKVPALETIGINEAPKGFHANRELVLVLDQQCMSLIEEFLQSMTASPSSKFGVLFTGPNGVGKSSIGLLTILFARAHGLPVMYLPLAGVWAACESVNEARMFFMQEFFDQNVDLIMTSSEIRPFFSDLIQGHASMESCKQQYKLLSRHLVANQPVCGYIADEVQCLTKAAATNPNSSFFAEDFTIWTSLSGRFRSQLLASAHGLFEFNLASGLESRRRFIRPMLLEDVAILLTHAESPFFVPSLADDASLREYIIDYIGGVPRDLDTLVNRVRKFCASSSSRTLRHELNQSFTSIRQNMFEISLKSWWDKSKAGSKATDDQKLDALLEVFADTAQFQPVVKDLYDFGLLYVPDNDGQLVRPVSKTAMLALHELYSICASSTLKPLSEIPEVEQGHHFEKQILAALVSPVARYFNSYRLRSPQIKCSFRLDGAITRYEKECDGQLLDMIVADPTMRVIWLSRNRNCVFDGVLMPPESEPGSPIIIFDPSVSGPFTPTRVDKVKRLSSFSERLASRFPDRKVHVCVFCPKDFDPAEATTTNLAKITSDDVFLVDGQSLINSKCGIRL